MSWSHWTRYFERNAARPLPTVESAGPVPEAHRATLARMLAVFQLGETGEGRIAHQVTRFGSPHIDDDWRESLRALIREEGRHARALKACLDALGGKALSHNWTHALFVFGRRLLGVRLKLLVLASAEVVSLVCYSALVEALAPGPIPDVLRAIRDEERAHLAFHVEFFHRETRRWPARWSFLFGWYVVGALACAVVLLDHRAAMRELGISRRGVLRDFVRWNREIAFAVTTHPDQMRQWISRSAESSGL